MHTLSVIFFNFGQIVFVHGSFDKGYRVINEVSKFEHLIAGLEKCIHI